MSKTNNEIRNNYFSLPRVKEHFHLFLSSFWNDLLYFDTITVENGCTHFHAHNSSTREEATSTFRIVNAKPSSNNFTKLENEVDTSYYYCY